MVEEPRELIITADPERLDEGPPEERACFSALGIQYGSSCLTEGQDGFVNKVRAAPLLSGYHLAEWIAWNWWRLRWEPRSKAPDWEFAHRFATIGEGYVWPNITISSDGERVALIANPTRERPNTPFRYLSDAAAVVGAREFEYVVDKFVEQIRGLLRAEHIDETNLDRIWNDIREERRDPEIARRRKLEALLGHGPDQVDESILERLLTDAKALGEPAMNEVAADHAQGGELLTAEALRAVAARNGFDARLPDVVRLAPSTRLPRAGEAPAWQLGAQAARALREQEKLGTGRIGNDMLAKMAGVKGQVLTDGTAGPPISFALDGGAGKSRVVLRSRWETGRRFELARLLGDRIVLSVGGRLFPATRAYTYRQKMQRSFAAEILSPFESVEEMLSGDYSMESQQDVAEYFQVSELTIRALLINHRRLEREDLDEAFDFMAA
jgi:hypothetical protein